MAQNEGFDDGGRTVVSSMLSAENAGIDLEWRSIEDLVLTRGVSLEGDVVRESPGVRAFSATGLFALGQTDGRVRVWSTRTGRLIRTFGMPDHIDHRPISNNSVKRVVISPDGALLAAAMGNSQISVFSVQEDKLLYSHHVRPLFVVVDALIDPGVLRFLDFSPDGKFLVSTDTTERGIRLWEARTGIELGRLSGHRDHTIEVSFSPDGKTLASTGGDGSLKLWHLPTRREVATLLETGAVGPVTFSPDGSLLIVGLEDDVRIFRAPTLVEIDREPDLDIHR